MWEFIWNVLVPVAVVIVVVVFVTVIVVAAAVAIRGEVRKARTQQRSTDIFKGEADK